MMKEEHLQSIQVHLKSIARELKPGHDWVVLTRQIHKYRIPNTSKLVLKLIKQANIKVLE